MKRYLLPILIGALMSTHSALAESSFVEIRQKIYANPSSFLPAYPGMTTWDVIKNLLNSVDTPIEGLSIRGRQILISESDEKPAAPKWLHPRGACAEGRWTITQPSAATGLFAAGTDVPAIIRVSSGDHVSEYPSDDGRIFGMAIKIYPSPDVERISKTRNIIMLDQDGFERSTRRHVFFADDPAQQVYFTNVAPARSALGKFLSRFFDRFDKPNFARPLYGVARATPDGDDLAQSVTPYEIHIQASANVPQLSQVYADFRTELESIPPGSLDIILQSFDGVEMIKQTIGTLSFGKFVVSDYCDLSLQFHHDAIEDQRSKYSDYSVLSGLAP